MDHGQRVVVVVVMGLSNLCTLKGLPKLPVWTSNTRGGDSAIACGDHEPNALSHELPITLPILTPVSCHGVPTYTIPSDPHRRRPHSRSTHITFVTRLKNGFPLMVKRIVPLFTQVTLDSERIRSKTSTIRSAQGHELCDYAKKLSGASKHAIQKSRGILQPNCLTCSITSLGFVYVLSTCNMQRGWCLLCTGRSSRKWAQPSRSVAWVGCTSRHCWKLETSWEDRSQWPSLWCIWVNTSGMIRSTPASNTFRIWIRCWTALCSMPQLPCRSLLRTGFHICKLHLQ
jgi:hypothetical protein